MDAYKKLIEQYPNHKLTFIDDRPHDDLPILLNDPKIKERSNIILINGYPTSIQSPHKSTLIDLNKNEIVKEGIKLEVPFEYIYSCYKGGEKHCGECESCLHLINALRNNNREDLIKKLF